MDDHTLLSAPLAELLAAASAVRHGTRITYSPKVFIPLTLLCNDSCGYCTFAQPPARVASPYLTPDEVLAHRPAGAPGRLPRGPVHARRAPRARYEVASSWLDDHGYASTVDYLAAMCRLVLDETGLLPHANAGALTADELAALRPVTASQGMMLETLEPRSRVPSQRTGQDAAERRLATLDAAGELAIPFTTGILVGIGETRARPDRGAARRSPPAIAATVTCRR